MRAKDILGRRGEAMAARYVQEAGLTVLERNWRCALGEIDIVAADGDTLVVVEVKTRSSLAFGHPFEAITAVKLARLQLLGRLWAQSRERTFTSCRVDALAVIDDDTGAPAIEYLKAVG